jgi:hypothetical protein
MDNATKVGVYVLGLAAVFGGGVGVGNVVGPAGAAAGASDEHGGHQEPGKSSRLTCRCARTAVRSRIWSHIWRRTVTWSHCATGAWHSRANRYVNDSCPLRRLEHAREYGVGYGIGVILDKARTSWPLLS